MLRRAFFICSVLVAAAVCANAQWIHQPSPGAPRTKDGKADLTAKAPRLRDGKPDLSGIWQIENPTREERYKFFFDGINNLGEDAPAPYFMNILYDFKPEDSPMRPETAAIANQHRAGMARDIPSTRCLPFGLPLMDAAPFPIKVLQLPGEIALLYEHDTTFRQIFTDGRKLPSDPTPSWTGYSVGKWDSDTLVAETIGFNDKAWLDAFGHPHSEDMRITERFRRKDFGHMELRVTVDDPKMYTRPFTVTLNQRLLPDTDLLESVCTENEKDWQHMPK